MDTPSRENETLLTPAEVAALFRVDPKTVTRWARSGKLSAIRTLGGHRRFLESEVLALMGVPGPRTPGPGRRRSQARLDGRRPHARSAQLGHLHGHRHAHGNAGLRTSPGRRRLRRRRP